MNSSVKKKNKLSFIKRHLFKMAGAGLLAIFAVLLLDSLPSAYGADAHTPNLKILTVYYSRTGHTRDMAQYIHEKVGGDILEIQPVEPYSDDYKTAVKQARIQLLTGAKPALQTINLDISSYDVIFLGSPRWWGTVAVPVLTFLSQYDLTGVTIAPFSTHGGGLSDRSFEDIELLAPEARILPGFVMLGNRVKIAKNEIAEWLRNLNLQAKKR